MTKIFDTATAFLAVIVLWVFLGVLLLSVAGILTASLVNYVFQPILLPGLAPISPLEGLAVFIGFSLLRMMTFWLP